MGLRVVGLFAGIGGIEHGFEQSGHESVLLCEIDPSAQAVLRARFADVPLVADVRRIDRLPDCDVVVAGFPCQDLSQAGRTAGIAGRQSGLVAEVFRLAARSRADWLVLENVPFMLRLDRGAAMRYLTRSLGDLGFHWAYRVVDTRAFGLPQRRQRVILVASRSEDPRQVVFHGNEREPDLAGSLDRYACGFYWTEGVRGLGWAVDAVPTLKGGSTIGIASPPAICFPDGFVGVPDLRDAERLQGFAADWTVPAEEERRRGFRWKLVGNAVSVPVARWLGQRLVRPAPYDARGDEGLRAGSSWPVAAWGDPSGRVKRADLGMWPTRLPYEHLERFLAFPAQPLSVRATRGFLARTDRSSLRFPPGFLARVRRHLEVLEDKAVAA